MGGFLQICRRFLASRLISERMRHDVASATSDEEVLGFRSDVMRYMIFYINVTPETHTRKGKKGNGRN